MTSWNREFQNAVGILLDAGVAEANLDAWYLLEYVTGMSRTDFLVYRRDELPADMEGKVEEFQRLVDRRSKRIPLSYLTGSRVFMGLDFYVDESVLIPRQDTECLVEEVIKVSAWKRILDLCTGSGCIAISIAALGNPVRVTGTDVSDAALVVAKKNGEELVKIPRVEWIKSDLFENVPGKYDIIVSNPPYIRTDVIGTLEPEVKEQEPILALDGGEDGLSFYREIIRNAGNYLENSGFLFLEIGHDQGDAVRRLLMQYGFRDIRIKKDLAGLDRIAMGRMP